jgi:TonB-linked SusC/RagA family outer membrane protein
MRGSGSRVGLLAAVLIAMLATCIAGTELQAQQVVVRGTVVVAGTAEPVASATVFVKGTAIGTATNDSGAFVLQVPNANATLVVSRIGYARTEVPLNGRSSVAIQLTRTAVSLSEVVVVGYGTQKRSDITGSVTSVPTDRLEEKPNTNVVQSLQGSMPGVTVTTGGAGAEPTLDIQVRGRNSISASTAPLVVVDGIPYNGTLSELNPNDIASIEVLKDASATAIYGTRGSNGVILVTSRKGAPGTPSIRYTGYAGTQTVANVPRLMNAQEFFDFKCARLRTSPTQTCESLLTPTELADFQAGVNTDWVRIGTRTGRQQNHDLSFSGGTEDTRYFVGGSILDVNGVAVNDQFNRATVRVNLDQKLRSWLSVGTSTQGSRTKRDGVPVNWTTAFAGNPLITPYDAAGNQLLIPWPEDPITNNPLESLQALDEDTNRRLFSSNYVQLSIPRVEGLTYRLNAGIDLADRDIGTYYGRNTQTGLALGGRSTVIGARSNDWTMENVVRYARTIGRSSFDVTGLLSEASTSLDADTTQAQGFPNDVLGFRSNLPLLTVPTFVVLESKLLSQMARLNYSFDERYLATITARRDGFSGFGVNNKYGVFPSLALGWNVSNESFFPWKGSVDALKLRFSYGKNGNQAIRPYQTFAQLDDRSYLNGDISVPGYIPSSLGNPDLKWETTLSKNVGVDLSMWGDRLRVTADAYSSSTSDLLLRRSISSVHGITSILQNIGKTANRGVELQVNTLNLDRAGWQWRTDFNISANRNKIVDLYGNQTDDIASELFIGQPIYVNYGYRFDGIFQNAAEIAASAQPTAQPGFVRVVDVNGDGKIDPLDRTFIGSREPRYTAGLTNSVKYRSVTVSAYFNTVQGVTRENTLLSTNQTLTDVRRNMLFREWWTPENGINTYPSNSNSSNPLAVAFYEDASFIRLKDLTLSYDLPPALTSRFGSEALRVYVNGRNLWTKTDWSGLDPELLGLNSLTAQRSVPLERVITAGLTVRF